MAATTAVAIHLDRARSQSACPLHDRRFERACELLASARRQLDLLAGIVESLAREHSPQSERAAAVGLAGLSSATLLSTAADRSPRPGPRATPRTPAGCEGQNPSGRAALRVNEVSLKIDEEYLPKGDYPRFSTPPHWDLADHRERSPSIASLPDERTELAEIAREAQPPKATELACEVHELAARLPIPREGASDQLMNACIDASSSDPLFLQVKLLLEGRADPSMGFGAFEMLGKEFSTGSPLAIAVLRGSGVLAELLISAGANPESTYSFNAGAEQVHWSGSAINAAVPSGDLTMMKELVAMRADLHCTASNGANLLWQAAYFGKVAIANYLLTSSVDIEQTAQSQDDSDIRYTPLHVASYAGHAPLVALLVEAKGSISTGNGKGVRPLDDALLYGHDEVARLLIESQGDLFRHLSFKNMKNHSTLAYLENESRSSRRGSEARQRCIEIVFARDNQNLTLAVARGLRKAPSLVQHLAKEDVVRFLRTPGETPMQIIQALFQQRHVRYWAQSKSYKQRRQLNECYINGATLMNVARGPDYDELAQLFNDKRVLGDSVGKFLNEIGPACSKVGCALFAPVDTYQCLLPLMHEDLDILRAIAENPRDGIFNDRGCQAIVHLKWSQEKVAVMCRMAMAFIEVMNLVLINALLNLGLFQSYAVTKELANALALIVWIVVVSVEGAQCVGYSTNGLGRRYFTSPEQWFDIAVILLTGSVIVMTSQLECDDTQQSDKQEVDDSCYLMPTYRTTLGIIVFVKWMRFLHALSSLESVGLRVLPITTAMFDIGPFCAVLGVYFLGACNMYVALGRQTTVDSFFIIYRLVVMGDVNLGEMEGLPPAGRHEDGTQRIPLPTSYHYIVRLMMLAISFVMGLAMMNIFIAMLCLSYSEATTSAWLRLMRMRAHVVLDHQSMRLGVEFLSHRSCRRGGRRRSSLVGQELSEFQVSRGGLSSRGAEAVDTGYLWFSCQRSQEYEHM